MHPDPLAGVLPALASGLHPQSLLALPHEVRVAVSSTVPPAVLLTALLTKLVQKMQAGALSSELSGHLMPIPPVGLPPVIPTDALCRLLPVVFDQFPQLLSAVPFCIREAVRVEKPPHGVLAASLIGPEFYRALLPAVINELGIEEGDVELPPTIKNAALAYSISREHLFMALVHRHMKSDAKYSSILSTEV